MLSSRRKATTHKLASVRLCECQRHTSDHWKGTCRVCSLMMWCSVDGDYEAWTMYILTPKLACEPTPCLLMSVPRRLFRVITKRLINLSIWRTFVGLDEILSRLQSPPVAVWVLTQNCCCAGLQFAVSKSLVSFYHVFKNNEKYLFQF